MQEVLIDPSSERQVLDLRREGFDDVLVLGRYRYASIRPALRMHSHGQRLEICYLESGQQTYYVGDERYDLTGGDLFITFPGERHGTGGLPEDRGVLYWVILNAQIGRRRFLDLPVAEGRALLDALLHLKPRHFRGRASLRQTLARIFDLDPQDHSEALRRVNVKNLLTRFLLDVISCAARNPSGLVSEPILAAQEYVMARLDETFCLNQIARHAGLSLSRFKVRFKTEVGMPPGEWIIRRKVERATELLTGTRQPVTQIALELGFSTSQYFATVIRRYTGRTPRQHRDAAG